MQGWSCASSNLFRGLGPVRTFLLATSNHHTFHQDSRGLLIYFALPCALERSGMGCSNSYERGSSHSRSLVEFSTKKSKGLSRDHEALGRAISRLRNQLKEASWYTNFIKFDALRRLYAEHLVTNACVDQIDLFDPSHAWSPRLS